MNNVPLAWIEAYNQGYNDCLAKFVVGDLANALTDKEITNLWCEVFNFPNYDCLTELDFKFCREIIRKAQEK